MRVFVLNPGALVNNLQESIGFGEDDSGQNLQIGGEDQSASFIIFQSVDDMLEDAALDQEWCESVERGQANQQSNGGKDSENRVGVLAANGQGVRNGPAQMFAMRLHVSNDV
jgi:hypothetical protein